MPYVLHIDWEINLRVKYKLIAKHHLEIYKTNVFWKGLKFAQKFDGIE